MKSDVRQFIVFVLAAAVAAALSILPIVALFAGKAHGATKAPEHWAYCSQWATPLPWLVVEKTAEDVAGTMYTAYVFDRDGDHEADLAALFPIHGGQTVPYPTIVYALDGRVRRVYQDMTGHGLCKDYVEVTDRRES